MFEESSRFVVGNIRRPQPLEAIFQKENQH